MNMVFTNKSKKNSHILDFIKLYSKSIIDGIISISFSSALGIGVLFSFIPVLIITCYLKLSATAHRYSLTFTK